MAEIKEVQIPINFENGFNIAGNNFSARNIVEACILAPLTAIILLMIIGPLDVSLNFKITLIFTAIILVGGGALMGLNNDPLSTFLINTIRSNLKKRVAYYNPRIKFEAKSALEDEELTKEKEQQYKSVFDKYKEQMFNTQPTIDPKDVEIDLTNVFFEDDIGIIDKPIEEMTKRERRQYEKAQKKSTQQETKGGFKLSEIFKKKQKERKAAYSKR